MTTIQVDSTRGKLAAQIDERETTAVGLALNIGTRLAILGTSGRGHIHLWADQERRLVGRRLDDSELVSASEQYVFVGPPLEDG